MKFKRTKQGDTIFIIIFLSIIIIGLYYLLAELYTYILTIDFWSRI